MPRVIVWLVAGTLAAGIGRAGETAPVHATQVAADAAVAAAADETRGFAADLSRSQDGVVATLQSAEDLTPGRYRLHALVASTPHDHILAEAVDLHLRVLGAQARFERERVYPVPGEFAPVFLDFTVKESGPVTLAATWSVGDGALD
jgi:hypothetical protein